MKMEVCILPSNVFSGEPGLMISPIKRRFEFDGYKGNKDLSDKKILHDVFKKGDKWYNSGDLMVQDKDYFVYFHDRIGDTFRLFLICFIMSMVSSTSWLFLLGYKCLSSEGAKFQILKSKVCLLKDPNKNFQKK